jgi:hypothetical protein
LFAHVGLFGHSHGGGAVFELARRLDDNRAEIGTFQLDVTGYVDAIQQGFQEARTYLPKDSQYHVNYYQTESWYAKGGKTRHYWNATPLPNPIGFDVNEDLGWTNPRDGKPLNHGTIDNFPDVQNALIDAFEQHMTR